MTERQELGSLEAMLFAHAEPVEAARLADALRLDTEETTELLQKLQKLYDERESGMVILYFEPDRWQMTTRPYYGEMVKRILDTRRNAPLCLLRWRCWRSLPTTSLFPAVSLSRFAGWIPRPPSQSCWTRALLKKRAVWICPANLWPFRSPIRFYVYLDWAASMTFRRFTARHRTTPSQRRPRAMTASWNGSDALWQFCCLSCG